MQGDDKCQGEKQQRECCRCWEKIKAVSPFFFVISLESQGRFLLPVWLFIYLNFFWQTTVEEFVWTLGGTQLVTGFPLFLRTWICRGS